MFHKILTVGLLVGFMATPGCVNAREQYDPYLGTLQETLEKVKPKYDTALRASGRDPELVENDVAELDDAIATLKRVRRDGPPPTQAPAAGGGQ